jgi:hypothetical protein
MATAMKTGLGWALVGAAAVAVLAGMLWLFSGPLKWLFTAGLLLPFVALRTEWQSIAKRRAQRARRGHCDWVHAAVDLHREHVCLVLRSRAARSFRLSAVVMDERRATLADDRRKKCSLDQNGFCC